ncbi:oligosaccharide flippase family protein [Halomarina pelagica]|uniref:oligosaccharide flippase family protein n=1 Tax=Halomarina pelagica TaxID=2961599 RepID=UPI0020C23A4B|nr:polysaccharide biosynthesis C-terminal domain-containing protein [Halomarina sp. BND7]
MNLRNAIGKVLSANVLSSVLSFTGLALFARELGPSGLAPFFLFQAAVGLLGLLANFGLTSAVEKRISERQHAGRTLSTAILLKALLLIPITVGVIAIRPSINEYIGANVALLLVGGIIVQQFGTLGLKVINGELRVGDTAVIILGQKVVWVGLGWILIEANYGVYGIIWSFIVSWSVVIAWTIVRSDTDPSKPTVSMARSLLSFGGYAAIGSVGGYVYGWLDVAILGLFVAQKDIGIYEVTWRVAGFVMIFQTAVRTVIFPQISQWNATDNTQQIESLLERALVPSLLFAIPALVGGILVGGNALSVIFGPRFSAGYLVLIIFLVEKIFRVIHLTLSPTLFAIDEPRFGYRGSAVAVVANIILNFTLIPEFGIIGAAIATATSSLLGAAVNIWYLTRFISIRLPVNDIRWMIVSSSVMALIVAIADAVIKVNGPILLGLVVSFGVVSYGICILVYTPIRSEVQRLVGG